MKRSFDLKRKKPLFISRTAFANALLLTGVFLFVGAAVFTGKVINDTISPLIESVGAYSPDEENTPILTPGADTGDTGQTTCTLTIPNTSVYAVQMGVFSVEENAQSYAKSIRKLGGAGYVRAEEGFYYVFAMCYGKKEDALSVMASLKDQGYSGYMYTLTHGGLKMEVRGGEESLEELQGATLTVANLASKLEEAVIMLDKAQGVDVIEPLSTIKTELGEAGEIFLKYSPEEKNGFTALGEFCKAVEKDISDVIQLEGSELSAGLKHTAVSAAFMLRDVVGEILK